MPNWCYNRITVYADEDTADKLEELKENFDELSAHHLSHLMHVNQMCILKRDSQQLDYYAGVFANV